jgi:hypothetical protein
VAEHCRAIHGTHSLQHAACLQHLLFTHKELTHAMLSCSLAVLSAGVWSEPNMARVPVTHDQPARQEPAANAEPCVIRHCAAVKHHTALLRCRDPTLRRFSRFVLISGGVGCCDLQDAWPVFVLGYESCCLQLCSYAR